MIAFPSLQYLLDRFYVTNENSHVSDQVFLPQTLTVQQMCSSARHPQATEATCPCTVNSMHRRGFCLPQPSRCHTRHSICVYPVQPVHPATLRLSARMSLGQHIYSKVCAWAHPGLLGIQKSQAFKVVFFSCAQFQKTYSRAHLGKSRCVQPQKLFLLQSRISPEYTPLKGVQRPKEKMIEMQENLVLFSF